MSRRRTMRGMPGAFRPRMAALTLAVLTLVTVGLPPASAAPSTKKYTATVSPTSASAGRASVLTFRIKNSAVSVQELGSANISIPAGWAISVCAPAAPCPGVVQDPTNLRTSGTPSRKWTATVGGGVIKLRNPGPTSRNRLRAGEYVDVAVSATAPCAAESAVWNVAAKQSNDFSGVGNDFALVGSAPTVTVTGACGGLDHFTLSAPASAVAGEGFGVTVVARDASNQPVTGYTGTVHFTSSDPNADLPPDTAFVAGDEGSRAFSGVILRTSGEQTITVRDTVVTSATGSAQIAVGADPAVAELDLQASATQITAGGSVTFTAMGTDRFGNSLGDVTSSTAFSMTDGECVLNTCSSTVAGAQVVTATNGTAQAETQIRVDPGPLDRIRVRPSLATIAAGEEQAYTVRGFDEFGNPLGNLTADASLSIAPDGTCSTPGSCGATTSGPHVVTALVGTFSDTADLLVEPAVADHLTFSSQPTRTPVAATVTPAVAVRVLDRFDNLVTGSTAPVTLEIGPGAPDSGVLSGGGPSAANGGIATFDDLSIDRSGVGYTLVATSPGLTPATSEPFEISDSLQDCQQQGGCTGTVTDATTSATVTVPTYEGVNGVDGALSVTLDPQNDADCVQSSSPSGSAVWVDPPDGTTFSAPIRVDLEIDKSVAPGTGVANFIFCKDNGPGTLSQSLPDCPSKNPDPPCVLKRSRNGVGDLLATLLIPNVDPRLATRK